MRISLIGVLFCQADRILELRFILELRIKIGKLATMFIMTMSYQRLEVQFMKLSLLSAPPALAAFVIQNTMLL